MCKNFEQLFLPAVHSKKRHILKTFTWRVIATSTTFILTLIFFRDDPNATSKASWVAVVETTIKMLLYYYHERVWFNFKIRVKSAIRHIMKTFSWRVIASASTFLIAWMFFRDDPSAVEKATGIALVESVLKMLFYYLHERAWHRSKYGLE